MRVTAEAYLGAYLGASVLVYPPASPRASFRVYSRPTAPASFPDSLTLSPPASLRGSRPASLRGSLGVTLR